MIQFIVLFISTILVGSLLYFYPPNVPMKLKMSLLGIAFLLALTGIYIQDTLSLGLALAAITAISFIAAYLADKRVNFVTTTGQTESVLSFSEEEAATVEDYLSEIELDSKEVLPENEVLTTDGVQEHEELVLNDEDSIIEQIKEDNKVQGADEIESIELVDLEIIEEVSEHESILENVNSVQELTVDYQLAGLTDEELIFLTETREISEEEVTNVPEPTDIEDMEILSQRALLLEELDKVEMVEEYPQEMTLHEEAVGTEEELSHDKDYLFEKNESVEDLVAEETVEEVQEKLTTREEETHTKEAHIMEEPIIEVEITSEEPIQVQTETVTPLEEVVEIVESVEVIASFEEQDDSQMFDTEEIEEEASVNEAVEMSTPDMNEELQDMFLSTLRSYEETGDHHSYQEMLVTLLNQKLSDKDFYLFSKLLLDSFMATSDYSNFNPLIGTMEEKLCHYPVIVEELQRYKEMNN